MYLWDGGTCEPCRFQELAEISKFHLLPDPLGSSEDTNKGILARSNTAQRPWHLYLAVKKAALGTANT